MIEAINDMPTLQTKKGTMNINSTVENKKDRFIVKEELAIPNNKPNIGEILQTTISIVENAGLMGVPIPGAVVRAIEILKKKAESEDMKNGSIRD